jgi:hypothetical protein
VLAIPGAHLRPYGKQPRANRKVGHIIPPLPAGWAKRGHEAPVPITGFNAKRVLFGAVDIDTGGRVLLVRPRQRGADFEEFLDELHGLYRGRQVALLLDEDSSHTADDSRDAAEDLGIELPWLPKRSPHLNPMDHLWRHGKQVVSANHQYASIATSRPGGSSATWAASRPTMPSPRPDSGHRTAGYGDNVKNLLRTT